MDTLIVIGIILGCIVLYVFLGFIFLLLASIFADLYSEGCWKPKTYAEDLDTDAGKLSIGLWPFFLLFSIVAAPIFLIKKGLNNWYESNKDKPMFSTKAYKVKNVLYGEKGRGNT